MSHVFISYSAKDEAYALQLNEELRRQGFITWIAKHDIPPGTRWEHAIPPAIEACAAFVVIMTPDAYQSEWVLNECDLAHTLKKPPFPMLLAGEVFFRYRSRQFEDVRNQTLPTTSFYSELGKAAPRELKREVPQVVSVPPDVSDILPQPFAWCEVPAGEVRLEYSPDEAQVVPVAAFYIAKYPITNAQFRMFIDAEGYETDAFWTVDGLKQREKNQRRWQDSSLNGADCPVVGVSWYEALAFCRWLNGVSFPSPLSPPHSNREGRSGAIMLPSERQWQRAAQGDDERLYPWGDVWDARRCNVRESGIGQPTPVTQYANGASPFGVLDMSGNVWEWCLTRYEERDNFLEGTDTRVLRGGSFRSVSHRGALVAARFNDFPFDGDTNIGFRVAWSSVGIEE